MKRTASASPSTNASHPVLAAFNAFWAARQPRERSLIGLAAAVMGTTLTWQIAIAPALQTWQEAPARQAGLDAQTGQMLQLQAQAKGLRSTAPMSRTAALQLLESSAAQWLGAETKVSLQGEQVRITLKAAPAEGLSRWLAQARSQAQALPVQAQLQKTTAAATPPSLAAPASAPNPVTATPPNTSAQALWSGTLVLNLR
jgi:general secretion pathway protein M